MGELKTKPNNKDVNVFINSVEPDKKREDSRVILKMMKNITGEQPMMWGDSIIGFGNYHYVYKSGREGDWFLTGFSPRKQALTLYMMGGFDKVENLLEALGKHKKSVGCLYLKRLDDVNIKVLEEIVTNSVERVKKWQKG